MRSIVQKIGVRHLPLRTPCLHALTIQVRRLLYALQFITDRRWRLAVENVADHVALGRRKKNAPFFSKRVRVPAFHPERASDQGKHLDILDNRYGRGLETRRRHGRKTPRLALVNTWKSRATRPLAGVVGGSWPRWRHECDQPCLSARGRNRSRSRPRTHARLRDPRTWREDALFRVCVRVRAACYARRACGFGSLSIARTRRRTTSVEWQTSHVRRATRSVRVVVCNPVAW